MEGPDDLFSVVDLMKFYVDWPESDRPVNIDGKDGISRALQNISTFWKDSELRNLGIMVDADRSAVSAYERIYREFHKIGVELPDSLPAEGLIHPTAERRVGVWVMPDNVSPGELESFLRQLVPDGDLWGHAIGATDRAINELAAPAGAANRDKAHLRTWLAWQDPPGLPFGTALAAGSLAAEHPAASSFARWFMNLYELSPKAAS